MFIAGPVAQWFFPSPAKQWVRLLMLGLLIGATILEWTLRLTRAPSDPEPYTKYRHLTR